jgi:hypothetical protein
VGLHDGRNRVEGRRQDGIRTIEKSHDGIGQQGIGKNCSEGMGWAGQDYEMGLVCVGDGTEERGV